MQFEYHQDDATELQGGSPSHAPLEQNTRGVASESLTNSDFGCTMLLCAYGHMNPEHCSACSLQLAALLRHAGYHR